MSPQSINQSINQIEALGPVKFVTKTDHEHLQSTGCLNTCKTRLIKGLNVRIRLKVPNKTYNLCPEICFTTFIPTSPIVKAFFPHRCILRVSTMLHNKRSLSRNYLFNSNNMPASTFRSNRKCSFMEMRLRLRFHYSVFKCLRLHIAPFLGDLEPFPLLRFRQEHLVRKRGCFHYSVFVRFHFLCSHSF